MSDKEDMRKARQFMRNVKEKYDDGFGTLMYTELAEDTAEKFNLSDEDGHIPEWVFDMAIDIEE